MATLTDKQAQLLLGKNFGSLAVLREDGAPEVTPVWVDWDGEYVLVNTLRARAKPGRVERDPRLRSPSRTARTRTSTSGSPARRSSSRRAPRSTSTSFSKKYVGEDSYPWRSPGDRRVILRFRPERVATYNLD